MKQEKLRRMIKAMYVLKGIIVRKNENDLAFKTSSKSKVINEIDQIIHLGLEEFYAFRKLS